MTEGTTFGIGEAVAAMKAGKRVARAGWNGKGMFAYYVPASSYPANRGAMVEYFGEGAMVPYNAYLALKGSDGNVSTWAPSCSDTLADDWSIVDEEAAKFERMDAEMFRQAAAAPTMTGSDDEFAPPANDGTRFAHEGSAPE